MKLCFLYHPNSEHARRVETYASDFRRQRGKTIDLLSLETREGATMASLYGIVSYPAILAIRNDGQLMKNWEGGELPLMDEVSGYVDQALVAAANQL